MTNKILNTLSAIVAIYTIAAGIMLYFLAIFAPLAIAVGALAITLLGLSVIGIFGCRAIDATNNLKPQTTNH